MSNDSSEASNSGAGLEAATHRAKQKTRDNSIQAPRITNNMVIILNILLSSQRAAGKLAQFLENRKGGWPVHKPQVSHSATPSSKSWAFRWTFRLQRPEFLVDYSRRISEWHSAI